MDPTIRIASTLHCVMRQKSLSLSSMFLVHLVRGFSTFFYLPMKCFIGSLRGDLIYPTNIVGIFPVVGGVGTKSTPHELRLWQPGPLSLSHN